MDEGATSAAPPPPASRENVPPPAEVSSTQFDAIDSPPIFVRAFAPVQERQQGLLRGAAAASPLFTREDSAPVSVPARRMLLRDSSLAPGPTPITRGRAAQQSAPPLTPAPAAAQAARRTLNAASNPATARPQSGAPPHATATASTIRRSTRVAQLSAVKPTPPANAGAAAAATAARRKRNNVLTKTSFFIGTVPSFMFSYASMDVRACALNAFR